MYTSKDDQSTKLLFQSFKFSKLLQADDNHMILRDWKSPQLPRTPLSILVDLNNSVVWKVLIFSRIEV